MVRMRQTFIVVFLLLVAFALRLYRLDAVSLRGDEAYSVVHWTAPPFGERWDSLIRDEPAPVGAFTLYWAWAGLAGTTEFAVRYLSVLGNVTGLAVVIVLARRLLRRTRLALLVGVLWALHPFLIWHAQDARVYGVLSALTPLTFYWWARLVDDDGPRWPYVLMQTLAIYLYYLEPFWIAAQGLYLLLTRPQRIRRALSAWVVVGVLSLPVLIQLYGLLFVSEYRGTASDADPALLFSWFVPTLMFGENTVPVWVGGGFVLLLAAGLISLRERRTAVLLASWLFVPVLLLLGASFFSSFFRPRYVITIIPALLIALVAVSARIERRFVPPLTVLAIGLISLVEVNNYFYNDPPKARDWPALVNGVAAEASDVMIFNTPDPAIEYYLDTPVYILPIGWQEMAWQAEMDRLVRQYRRVFVLTGQDTAVISQYLGSIAQPIPGDVYPGVSQYRQWPVWRGEIETSLDLPINDIAVLRGYTTEANTALILYWQPLAQTETEYSVLLHLERTPDAPPDAVLDHAVAAAVVSTRTWTPGTLYRDPVALPPDLPPGAYTIWVGLYESGANRVPERHAAGTLMIR